MSVLIKNMDVPHDCLECYVAQFCKEYQDEENKRPYGCPLVEVPEPHGRLIDADELETKHHWTDDYYGTEYVEMEDIDNAPTVIEGEGK